MREIIFRGKRISSKGWIYGDLINANSMRTGERFVEIWSPLPEGETDPSKVEYGIVNPQTVGQFTGQTDQAGQRIFEGDIVDIHGENGYWLVEWDVVTSSFTMSNPVDQLCVTFDNYHGYEMEVVGNIYDSPELLEV